jgi:hypothetical protein
MSSDQEPPGVPGKSAPVTSHNKVSLSELIAKTPGAQTREQLLERIKAREGKRTKTSPRSAPSEDQLSTPEPLPIIDKPANFAADFWERFNTKQKEKLKPRHRSKPKLIVDNDKPGPRDEK